MLFVEKKKKKRKCARQAQGVDWRSDRNWRVRDDSRGGLVSKHLDAENDKLHFQPHATDLLDTKGKPLVATASGGFFSACSQDTQVRLRETRARLLIAKNEREAKEEEAKLQRMESPEAIVRDMIRVTAMAGRLLKQTKDDKIGGWAATVVESLTKSVAESAPSSVPSLDSVGYGKSALRSSDGSDGSEKSQRQIEYECAIRAVDCQFDEYPSYADDDYDLAINTVKARYADVAYSAEEKARNDRKSDIVAVLSHRGVGFDEIQDSLRLMGLNDEN